MWSEAQEREAQRRIDAVIAQASAYLMSDAKWRKLLGALSDLRVGMLRKRHRSVGHVWQGRFKSPVIQDDAHLLVVIHYIEANPLRAGMVTDPGDYSWSSYPAHGLGRPDPLQSPLPELESLGRTPAERQDRWRRKMQTPQGGDEILRVRESVRTGKSLGSPEWAEAWIRGLRLDLNPRPRGRPRKVEN